MNYKPSSQLDITKTWINRGSKHSEKHLRAPYDLSLSLKSCILHETTITNIWTLFPSQNRYRCLKVPRGYNVKCRLTFNKDLVTLYQDRIYS